MSVQLLANLKNPSLTKVQLHIDTVIGLPNHFPYEGLVHPITLSTCAAKKAQDHDPSSHQSIRGSG